MKTEPKIFINTPVSAIDRLPSPFPPLTTSENATDWGKELQIGSRFAKDGDYYRAITSFKRARFLASRVGISERRQQQIEFNIFFAYYLGRKYDQVIETYEGSPLELLPPKSKISKQVNFELFEAYVARHDEKKAQEILKHMQQISPQLAHKMKLYKDLTEANLTQLKNDSQLNKQASQSPSYTSVPSNEKIYSFLQNYDSQKKSIRKAELLNAMLPGAGYFYVGQKQSGVTSFILNALFIAATWQFIEKGQIPAGIITAGIEVGWYVGGIRGAGIAAKQYNDLLYSNLAKDTMIQGKIAPLILIQYGF